MKVRSMCVVALVAATGIAGALVGAVPAVAIDTPTGSAGIADNPLLGVVFAPGTDLDDIGSSVDALPSGPQRQQLATHWYPPLTALNNGGFLQGDALELTWSIIPDGTMMPSQDDGDATCNSNLIATFNGIYGAGLWQSEIQQVWNDWTELAGNKYTPAVPPDANGTPIDDGAAWPTSLGLAGVRGDIRIGGCNIDGDSNTLAYSFYPSNGDMKIDATDSFFATRDLTTAFHNVFSHEHGHGAGLAHVCPINGTKLMEPTVNLGFRGLQHDDIRGVQRGYGDRFELINNPNDSSGAATPLTPSPTLTETQLSLDSTSDTDWFTFTADAGDTANITVDPNGFTYNEGPDIGSNLCNRGADPGSPLNSKAIQDLSFEIRNSGGVLATVDATGAGVAESISDFALPASGTYYVRVAGSGTDDAQLYDLTVTKNSRAPMDFGDAPDSYPTLFADDGARHGHDGSILGSGADVSEPDGIPTPDALGDDNTDTDDEDGVTFTSSISAGQVASVAVSLNAAAADVPLNAWIDFNGDGDWNDTGEQIFTDQMIAVGTNNLDFVVPRGATAGSTYARFRISDAGGLTPSGFAPDGEVEDYRVTIVAISDVVSLDPARLLDTRPTGDTIDDQFEKIGTLDAGETIELDIVGRGGLPTTGIGAAVLNITMIRPDSNGFVTIYPCGTRPLASSMNAPNTGGVVANEVIAKLSPTGTVCLYTSTPTNLAADITGYIPTTSGVVSLDPARLLDTRPTGDTIDDQFEKIGTLDAGETIELDIVGRGGLPTTGIGAAVLNITMIRPDSNGFVTIYPCGTRPLASSMNAPNTGGVVANEVIAKLSPTGTVCLYTSTPTNLAADITGYIATEQQP